MFVATALVCLASPAWAAEPVKVDSFGMWNLPRLGHEAFSVPASTPRSVVSLPFALPEGARQGPRTWYLIHHHFELTLSADSGEGFVVVSAATNGRTASSIEITTRRVAGRLRVDWSGVNMLEGPTGRADVGHRVEVREANFLQFAGVKGGLNSLDFQLEQFGGAKVESLRVLGDSGLEYSPLGPPVLRLRIDGRRAPFTVGRIVDVRYELTKVRGRAIRNVRISATADHPAMRPLGRRERVTDVSSRPIRGTFRFRPRRPGAFEVTVVVRTGSGRLVASTIVRVRTPAVGNDVDPAPVGAVLVATGAFAAFLVGAGRRRRTRRASPPGP